MLCCSVRGLPPLEPHTYAGLLTEPPWVQLQTLWTRGQKLQSWLCRLSEKVALDDVFLTEAPPGSSVHGILQARILEWVAIFYSIGSS